VAVALGFAAPAGAALTTYQCGARPGTPILTYAITSQGMGCPTAKRLIRTWISAIAGKRCTRSSSCQVFENRCRGREGAVHYKVTCVGGPRKVTFWAVETNRKPGGGGTPQGGPPQPGGQPGTPPPYPTGP
jgi:hypothetical protein